MLSGFMQFTGKCLRIMSIVASITLILDAEILIGPQNTEAVIEEIVELHCKGSSGKIEWHHMALGERYPKIVYQNDFIYDGYRERFKAERTSDAKYSLIINGVKTSDAGKFICLENSETPLQVTAELIVLERFPSNESCAGKYTCKPVCNELELSCEMKAHGNHIPSMRWVDSEGKSIDSTDNMANEIIISTVKLKSDPQEAVLYTCRLQYPNIPLISKFHWTYSTSEWESSRKLINPGQQSPAKPVLLVTLIAILSIVSSILVTAACFLIARRSTKRRRKRGITRESSEYLVKTKTDAYRNAAKTKFTPCTPRNMGNPIHGLAAIDDEVFIITRDGCVVEVFDLHEGCLKRFWSVDGLINPNDMAACPVKKTIFICDWKKTAENREIYCLDINGKLLCKWLSDHERGCISITRKCNVIVANSWYNTITECTSTGAFVKTILTGKDKLHLWHAVKLDDGNFVASFGDAKDDYRGICILDEEGRVVNSVRSDSDLFRHKPLSVPRSIAADKKGNIYICDLYNFRIIILNSELKFKGLLDTTDDGDKLRGPLRICVHEFDNERWLLVADSEKEDKKWSNGRVAVWNLH